MMQSSGSRGMDFSARKRAVLEALTVQEHDKSRKGGVDAPIVHLIACLNSHPCFFTTSSCSGRIVLFLDAEPSTKNKTKKGGDWIFVSHQPAHVHQVVAALQDLYLQAGKQGLLVFKFEPFILALECSSASAAQRLVACSVAAGFRESGITSLGRRVIVAVRCSIRLEVPVADAGRLLVSEDYLELLTGLANEKMAVNRARTDKFLRMFVDQVEGGVMTSERENFGEEHVPLEGSEEVIRGSGCTGSGGEQGICSDAHDGGVGEEDVPVTGKELEVRERSLCQLKNRQIRLLSRLRVFETKLATSGFAPRDGRGSHSAENELAITGQQTHHHTTILSSSPSLCEPLKFDFLGHGSEISVVHGSRGGSAASKETAPAAVLADAGVGRTDGCSLLAAPLVVSGENVVNLQRWSHSACTVFTPQDSDRVSLIIFGGYGGPGRHARQNDLLLFDVNSATLQNLQANDNAAPSARQGHTSVVIGDKMIVIGGREGPQKPLGDLSMFSLTDKRWRSIVTTGATFPPRHRHAAVAIASNIFVFGGLSETKVYDDLHVLETRIMHWRKLLCKGQVPCARFAHSLACIGQNVYLFGGRDQTKIYGELFALDVGTLCWNRVETTGNLPVPRFSHSMTACGENLIIMGGCPITKTSEHIFVLHVKLLCWRRVDFSPPVSFFPVRHSVCAVGNKLFVIGGGAACFAFGAAFNSPFLLDVEGVLPSQRDGLEETAGAEEELRNTNLSTESSQTHHASDNCCQSAPASFTVEVSHELSGSRRLAGMRAANLCALPDLAVSEDEHEHWVLVFARDKAKQGKDSLKTLGWLDLQSKTKVLGQGEHIAFPITAVAVDHFRSLECVESLSSVSESLAALLPYYQQHSLTLSTLASLRGTISRASLPRETRRLNSAQSSLRVEVGALLRKRDLPVCLLSELPRRWERLGDMVVLPSLSFSNDLWLTFGDDLWKSVAKALGVSRLARQACIASTATRDSQLQLLLGSDGWVEHRENGILYCFDATKCMFSSGNVSEKLRVASMNCHDEVLVDLFAGIGYFVLPFLMKAGARHAYACEWNPHALRALRYNIKVNSVEDRCTVIEGDSRITAPERIADRVCLGLLPTSEDSWSIAVKALKYKGGTLHIHENVKDTAEGEWIDYLLQSLRNLASSQGLDWQISVSHVERVKWYAPHIRHVVVDVECSSAANA